MIYDSPPPGFNPKFEAVGCFLEHQEKILLLKRGVHKSNGGTWGLPGGKIEPGETVTAAIKREITEETGLMVAEGEFKKQFHVFVRYPEFDFIYHVFRTLKTDPAPIRINPREHDEFAWVVPAESDRLNLMPDGYECISRCARMTAI